jgi:hypothetical protein
MCSIKIDMRLRHGMATNPDNSFNEDSLRVIAANTPHSLHSEQQIPNSSQSSPMGTIADGQFYAQTWVVQPLKSPQNALINISYTCSVIGLIVFGIILGPIGFILGLVAKLNGDKRGVKAMAMGAVVTVLSAIILVWFIKSGI